MGHGCSEYFDIALIFYLPYRRSIRGRRVIVNWKDVPRRRNTKSEPVIGILSANDKKIMPHFTIIAYLPCSISPY
jgi:hypothetical protein